MDKYLRLKEKFDNGEISYEDYQAKRKELI